MDRHRYIDSIRKTDKRAAFVAVLCLLIFSGALFFVIADRHVEIKALSPGDSIGYIYSYKHISSGEDVEGEIVNGTIEASFQSSINLDVIAKRETEEGNYLLINRTTYTPDANKTRNYQFWLSNSSNEVIVKSNGELSKRGIWLRKAPPLGKRKIKPGDQWMNDVYGETYYKARGFKSVETQFGNITCLVVSAEGISEKNGKSLFYEYTYYLSEGVPTGLVRMDFKGVLADEPKDDVRNVSSIYQERVDLVLVDDVKPMETAPRFDEIMNIESEPVHEVTNREVEDFTLPTDSGGDFNLYETLNETPVLIMFIATWCPHCHNETISLLEIQDKYGSDVQFITFAVDRNLNEEDMEEFKNETGLDWQIGDGRPIMGRYGVTNVPTYIVLDQNGKIVFRNSGKANKKELQEVLNSLS